MFHSLIADVVFWLVLAVVWAGCYHAKDPPGMQPGTRLEVVTGRVISATFLTAVLGVLPALIAAALVAPRAPR